MRTWTKLVPAVLLAMSLTLAPAHADELTAGKIAALQKEVDDLKREVENLKKGTAQDIREIKELLRQMTQQPVVSRSNYTPGAGGSGNGSAPAGGMAPVVLRNHYLANATFRINGQAYVVSPSKTAILNAPLGTITWEVSVDGHGLLVPSTAVSLTPSGRTFSVFPQ